jgi:hypothetical protein
LRATAHPCGCKSGAAASLFAMLFWPVFVVVSGRVPRSIAGMLVAVVVYGGVVIGAGVAGKVVGIVVARRTHRRVRRQLQARYAFLADQGR